MAEPASETGSIAFSRPLLGLILGQVCVHAAMAGTRLAVPLQALEQGASEWVVGLLLAMFALAPVALALPAGRLADRHGFHRPMRLAVLLASIGVALAAGSQAWWDDRPSRWASTWQSSRWLRPSPERAPTSV